LIESNRCSILVSPSAAENQTNEEQQPQAAPATTKKNLSSINSFEEWKQQQLHADLLSLSCFVFEIK
jgi:hypothetical protein